MQLHNKKLQKQEREKVVRKGIQGNCQRSFGRQGAQSGEELEFLGIAMVLENIKRNGDRLRRF